MNRGCAPARCLKVTIAYRGRFVKKTVKGSGFFLGRRQVIGEQAANLRPMGEPKSLGGAALARGQARVGADGGGANGAGPAVRVCSDDALLHRRRRGPDEGVRDLRA